MSTKEKKYRRGPRTEPTLGDIGDLDAPSPRRATDDAPKLPGAAPPPSPPPPPRPSRGELHRSPRRRGWLWPLLLLILIAAVALAWVNQDSLRALFPRTQLNTVLSRADQALAAGRLTGRDGTSARELYSAANALEPDNDHARSGLRNVAGAELARASKAIAAAHYDDAQNGIAVARDLLGGGTRVDAVQQALDHARNAQPQNHTDVLTDRAQQALAAGKLESAGGLYQRALASGADNAVARHGLDKVGDALAVQARADLKKGDIAAAGNTIARIGNLLPRDGDLPALRAELAQARQQSDQALADHLKQGQADLRAGHFSGSGNDNALAQFRAVLAVDPDNASAKAGLGQVAQALILRANAAIDAGDTKQAGSLLDAAQKLAPKSADLAAARSRLDDAQNQARTAHPQLSDARQAHIQQLLKRAKAATRAGDIMLPPGASAYDLYRAALAVDGNNQAARDGLHGLPAQTATLFKQALNSGRLDRASDLLATLDDLAPGDPAQQDLRDHLASAWLDRAEKAINRGDKAAAQQALGAARRLRPNAARLQELEVRAQGG